MGSNLELVASWRRLSSVFKTCVCVVKLHMQGLTWVFCCFTIMPQCERGKVHTSITAAPCPHLPGACRRSRSPLCLLPQGQGFIFRPCLSGRWTRHCDAVDAHTAPSISLPLPLSESWDRGDGSPDKKGKTWGLHGAPAVGVGADLGVGSFF